ncbi:hypothetical protein [Cytobacillus oceanisediminis]|uniref:hypothetical protein n=1 Tax=Cytobacillus oceanisediminis TaxID=665099 RepID=UPI001FB4AD70|nr:hypothetical protein [Cytobacillus oceanisediminis]UOE58114.1 hypothetical protein IRB79_26770 [Cytobacillus oceanisediminis]
MYTIWIKTVGEESETGFTRPTVSECIERFKEHKSHWDKVQKERKEKPYIFTAYIEKDGELLVPWIDLKKVLNEKKVKSYGRLSG